MKTIGLVGGPSWDDTVETARRVNVHTRIRCGGLRSAPCVIAAYDPSDELAAEDRQAAATVHGARSVSLGGAQVVALCSADLHTAAAEVEAAIPVRLVHLADAIGDRMAAEGHARIGLLGARTAVEGPSIVDRLRARGIEVIRPSETDIREMDRIVTDEVHRGRRPRASRERLARIVVELAAQGAEAVVNVASALEPLLDPDASAVPVYDGGELHAAAIVDAALR